MKILVTGVAGFIGYHVTKKLIAQDHIVYGIDNLNDYYDPQLKKDRLSDLQQYCEKLEKSENFKFELMDLVDAPAISSLFKENNFDRVIHLAAQAGVRYSIENPKAYIDSNIVGFLNILESCRAQKTPHLVYASSSSVYGMNSKIPFSTHDKTDNPISLYAATKKSNELMAHSYSHLFDIPTTGLRFFTVYGPWGRPDMAYFSFSKSICVGEPINVFNKGKMERDFTYIDDIVNGIVKVMDKIPASQSSVNTNSPARYKIYNIGNNNPITLDLFISSIENALGKKAIKNELPMQPGDVPLTYADVDDLIKDVGFKPSTNIETGMATFTDWYLTYSNREKSSDDEN
ncbi:NAD-dependent epimerase [Pseudomonas sp. NPDC086251]|jgi:UDP-glucuronate 4-epimerase|uniref:NAD-dependent epimerase n=1 Tax=Pseudomonas sp. NPDC086251 TaxID=3364431 RepID=UPI00383858E7